VPGHSLPELVVVLAIMAVLAGLAAPRVAHAVDVAAVHSASHVVASVLAGARRAALQRGERVAVVIDSTSGIVRAGPADRPLLVGVIGAATGAILSASRDSIAFGPTGLGYGAANTSIIVRRGGAADTVVVSREGRVRG